jgi:hypothetical protein
MEQLTMDDIERETLFVAEACNVQVRVAQEQKLCVLRMQGVISDEELDRLLRMLDTGACGA